MHHTTRLPSWLEEIDFIFGREGEGEGQEGSEGSGEGESGDESSSGKENDQGDPDGSEGSDDELTDADRAALRKVIDKERRANKAVTKELAKLRRIQQEQDDAKKGETEAEKAKRERAEEKLTRLTQGFRRSALDQAIRQAAEKHNFVDPGDAVSGVDRADIEVEQDDEDPSDITIDPKSVERAVKALATKKPHWIRTGTDDGEPSGSTFGRANGRNQKQNTEDQLRQQYPALNH